MAELLAAFLELITPKSKAGKIVWGCLAVLVIVVAIVELVGAMGH